LKAAYRRWIRRVAALCRTVPPQAAGAQPTAEAESDAAVFDHLLEG